MLKNKQIVILTPNYLMGLGLKYLLTEFFSPGEILIFNQYSDYLEGFSDQIFDVVIIDSVDFVMHNDHFYPIRNKIIVMTESLDSELVNGNGIAWININGEQSDIIEQLDMIFSQRIKIQNQDLNEGLTNRELEVLKLVAIGMMNKQIADTLSISSNTVITHRKNITRKLGINSVSGLTIYALINGLINSDDIQNPNF